jgi:hypothetical protein
MYFISQVDGVEINMDDFLTDTFDSWSNKMKRDGEFADHIAVKRIGMTEILFSPIIYTMQFS